MSSTPSGDSDPTTARPGSPTGTGTLADAVFEAEDFPRDTGFGLFRDPAINRSLSGVEARVAVVTRREQASSIRQAAVSDRSALVRFVDRTDFETETLLVISRAFGGRGGDFHVVGFTTTNGSAWHIATVREPGPMQAESWSAVLVRVDTVDLPDRLRLVHTRSDGETTERVVVLRST